MNNTEVVNDLIISRAYKTDKEKENTIIYPGNIQKKAEQSSQERWKKAVKYNPSLAKIEEELTKNPEALPGYALDIRGNVVRKPDDSYNIAHFSMRKRRQMRF